MDWLDLIDWLDLALITSAFLVTGCCGWFLRGLSQELTHQQTEAENARLKSLVREATALGLMIARPETRLATFLELTERQDEAT